jgi:hypothetical protein
MHQQKKNWIFFKKKNLNCPCDAPPNSWIDSTASPNVKRAKGQRVQAHFLAHNTSRVKGCVGAPRWGLGRTTSG